MFYGREDELKILNKRYESDRFEFGYVYGQRRIGKTTLVDEFAKNKKSIVLFASDSDDKTIRDDFTDVLSSITGITYGSFKNWDEFFEAVAKYFDDDKGVLIIDEYPNIMLTRDGKRKKTDFVSKLQNAIDHIFLKQKFLLILTGSNVSFMEKEVGDTNAPLYKRNTFQLFVSKLEWTDAVKMLHGMNYENITKTLCLTDTFPYYLSLIDTTKSFEENLDNLFFAKDAPFVSDPSKIITSEIAASGLYASIMRNISSGINSVSALADALNIDTATISVYLEKMIKNKVVSKHYYFDSKRITYYKIIDRMTSFYFRFIYSNVELIKLGYGEAIKNKYKNAIDNFIHLAFEDVCITYLNYLNKKMMLNTLYLSFEKYSVEHSILNRSIELDIVSSSDDYLLAGECKFSVSKKSINVYNKLKENISVEPFKKYKHQELYIFSSSGFDDRLLAVNDSSLHLIDLEKMLK